MAIAPLQLPVWKDTPQLNFAPLNEIGDAIAGYRQRSALADNLPAMLGQPQQQGNSLATLGQPQQPSQGPSGDITPTQTALLTAAAQKYGIDPNYLLTAAKIEGTTKNPASSADGLGQFIDSTAKQYGVVRGDDASAADAFARFTLDNKSALTRALGREPTPGELYLAHQQGAGGAAKLLTNPNAPAASLVGQGAVVNNGGSPLQTAGDFSNRWTRQFGGAGPGPTTLAYNGDNPPLASSPQSGSVSSQPGGAAMQPSQAPTQVAQAAPQAPQAAPGAPLTSSIPPDTMARIQAMIRAGGPAQAFAMAILQKYVVPQTPVVVNEGGIAFNPVTGAVIARGSPKPVSIPLGGDIGAMTQGQNGPELQRLGGGQSVTPGAAGIKFTTDRIIAGDEKAIAGIPRGNAGAMVYSSIMDDLAARAQRGEITPQQLISARGAVDAQIKGQKDFGTGPEGGLVKQYSVVADHLQLLRDVASAMKNGDIRGLNALRNTFRTEFGSDLPTNSSALSQLVSGEIIKGVTNSQGALGDRDEMLKHLSPNSSPEQIVGAIDKVYTPAIMSQMKALERQYKFTTKQGNFEEMLSDRAKQMLHSGEGAAALQGQQQPPKVSSYSEVSQSLSNAKAALARGAPRDAVIKKLIDGGVPKEMADRL